MMEQTLLAAVAEPGIVQRFATPVVLVTVLALAAFGFQHGLFLAVLAGMALAPVIFGRMMDAGRFQWVLGGEIGRAHV